MTPSAAVRQFAIATAAVLAVLIVSCAAAPIALTITSALAFVAAALAGLVTRNPTRLG